MKKLKISAAALAISSGGVIYCSEVGTTSGVVVFGIMFVMSMIATCVSFFDARM